jgi:hypothetical protein
VPSPLSSIEIPLFVDPLRGSCLGSVRLPVCNSSMGPALASSPGWVEAGAAILLSSAEGPLVEHS